MIKSGQISDHEGPKVALNKVLVEENVQRGLLPFLFSLTWKRMLLFWIISIIVGISCIVVMNELAWLVASKVQLVLFSLRSSSITD